MGLGIAEAVERQTRAIRQLSRRAPEPEASSEDQPGPIKAARAHCRREAEATPAWRCAGPMPNGRQDDTAARKQRSRCSRSARRNARRALLSAVRPSTPRVTLGTADDRCPDCSTEYGHSEALRLPLPERRAA